MFLLQTSVCSWSLVSMVVTAQMRCQAIRARAPWVSMEIDVRTGWVSVNLRTPVVTTGNVWRIMKTHGQYASAMRDTEVCKYCIIVYHHTHPVVQVEHCIHVTAYHLCFICANVQWSRGRRNILGPIQVWAVVNCSLTWMVVINKITHIRISILD